VPPVLLPLKPNPTGNATHELNSVFARNFNPRLPRIGFSSGKRVIKGHADQGWVNRGEMLILLQRVDEALASYDRALTIDPRLASAHLGRANVFTIKRNLAEAFAALASTP